MAMKAISIVLALGIGLTVLAVVALRCLAFVTQMVDPLRSNLGE
jgi:hypothetical protein